MSKNEIFIAGTKIELGKRLGRGGEGDVFALQKINALALKVYTLAELGEREAKIKAMVDADLRKSSNSIAFPLSVAQFADGSFAGFVMPLVAKHRPVFDLYSPAPRKRYFPDADFRFVVRVALNVSRAIDAVHRTGCVIGDINHSGILVSERATAALIDADNFQFSHNGKVFLCKVGVPEFTPPELQGVRLSSIVRTINHDAFAIAVLIFQLLFMGRHPFAGAVSNGGDITLEQAIKEYRFAYSMQRSTGLVTPPGTVRLSDVPKEVAELFERAFSNVASRPSPGEWIDALKRMEASLVRCSVNRSHYFAREAGGCTWCRVESQAGIELFLDKGVAPAGPLQIGETVVFDRALGIDLPAIEALPQLIVGFTPHSVQLKPHVLRNAVLPVAIWIAAVALLVVTPQAWLISGILALVGFGIREAEQSSSAYHTELRGIDARLKEAVASWRSTARIVEAHSLKAEIGQLKSEYENLTSLHSQTLHRLKSNRNERLRLEFLEKHFIQHAKISGIGPTKLRVLSSYGFDTAADLKRRDVTTVPGIGPTYARNLSEWRDDIERMFVPKFSEADELAERALADREIRRIAMELTLEAAQKEKQLLAYASLTRQYLESPPAELAQLLEQRRKVAGEVTARKGTVPPLDFGVPSISQPRRTPRTPNLPTVVPSTTSAPTSAPTQPSPRQPPSVQGPPSSPSFSTPPCPRCGRTMVRRVARRGQRKGRPFWGCSRFPSCKGTRNI
jgi:DNA-binding helix-hairpin-helix protein with protein kinase domain